MRLRTRRLANEIGVEAMKLMDHWPANGEGRAIKEATEQVSRLMDSGRVPSLPKAFSEQLAAANLLEGLLENQFFSVYIASKKAQEPRSVGYSLGDAIRRIATESRQDIEDFENVIVVRKPTSGELLRRITPPQKLGPIEFEFINNVLRIRHSASVPGMLDKANVEKAREALLGQGRILSAQLKNANVDGRICQLLEEVVSRIDNRQDVIALGIANVAIQLVVQECSHEIAEPTAVALKAFSINIAMYVAQFPDWVRYSENAAMAEYTVSDVEAVYSAGVELVDRLQKAGEAVDKEIPRTIAWMITAVRDHRTTAKRAVFGTIRTIENLVAIVFTSFSEWLGAADDGIRNGVKAAVKPATAMFLLLAAADAATSVSPTAARVLQSAWLGEAAKMVRREVDNFSQQFDKGQSSE